MAKEAGKPTHSFSMAEEVPQSLPTTTQEEPQTLPPQPEAAAPAPAPAAPPPLPAAAPPPPPPEPQTKKRKLQDAGFHNSAYFKIRTIVKDLRPLFLEVVQAPDFRNSNAANDILKQISTLTELSKQLRNELTTVEELKKPSEESKSLPGAIKKEPTNSFQEVHAPNANVIPESLPERAKTSETKDSPKQLEDGFLGSYVVGGSPVGWNFLAYSGIKTVYYGVTKEEFRSRQATK